MWNAPTAFRLLYPKPKSKISVPLNPEESPEMKSFHYIWFLNPHTRGSRHGGIAGLSKCSQSAKVALFRIGLRLARRRDSRL
jgi:hypothetical protein